MMMAGEHRLAVADARPAEPGKHSAGRPSAVQSNACRLAAGTFGLNYRMRYLSADTDVTLRYWNTIVLC